MLKRLTIPSLLIMLSSGAHALTLGQIHVHSFINQPLKATIDLQGVKADELTALKIKLASRAAFKNAGVDWSAQLEGLSFSIIHKNTGPAIRVTSSKAVAEPFLSFIVDASWANGKMSKDYTLLLDPPLYSGKKAEVVAVADVASVTTAKPAQSGDIKPQQQKVQQPQSRSSAGPAAQTMTGNSLWQVASKVRPANATMQQTMVAIHEENPESFLRGNMNRLKKGQLLRIPSAQVIEGITASAAVNRVAKHERALRAGRSVKTSKRLSPEIVALAANPASTESPVQPAETVTPPTGSDSGGRLSLDSASDDVNEGAMRGDPAFAGKDFSTGAAGSEENKALRSRVALLEEQLKVAHKLIRMKGELAQLQQLYRQIDTQRPLADDDQTEITDEQLLLLADAGSVAAEKTVDQESDKESDQESSGADDVPVQDEPLATNNSEQQLSAQPESDKSQDADSSQQDGEQQTAAATSDETLAEDAESSLKTAQQKQQAGSAMTESETVAEANTEIDAQTESEPENVAGAEKNITPSIENLHEGVAAATDGKPVPLIQGIENNLLYTAGGVAILGLLLAFLLGRGSNKSSRSEAPLDERIPLDGNLTDTKSAGESSGAVQEGERVSKISDADEPLVQQSYLEPAKEFEPPETFSIEEPVTLDPLQLVKVLMSNGENTKAQEVLMQAVAADPARMELHMQLIELLHANKDRHAFEAEMNQLETSGLKLEPGDWQKIERMHADLLPTGNDSPQAESDKNFAAEIIDLDDFAVGNNSDEHVAENRGQSDSDLEEALRDFEMVLEEKNSDEFLSEAGIALDETATIQDNPVANAMPGAHVVEDLELEEDLVVEKIVATDQGIDVISLDDSFGIDSHISSDFDDVFSASADQHEKQSDTPPPAEEERLPAAVSEDISITSFDADPSTLKQAELDAKIDLAAAFADMGDLDGAKDILDEVMSEGSEKQQLAAREMLKKYL